MTSRATKVALDSSIQRCSSSRCSNVNILSALWPTGVVRNAVPFSVGFMVVDIGVMILLFMCVSWARSIGPLHLFGCLQFPAQDFADEGFGQAFTKCNDFWNFVRGQVLFAISDDILACLLGWQKTS